MEEKEEKKVNTEELKSEASTTVNQVKEIIKNQTGIITDADNIAIYGICEECNSK